MRFARPFSIVLIAALAGIAVAAPPKIKPQARTSRQPAATTTAPPAAEAPAEPAAPAADEPIGDLKNQTEKVSYALGLDIGRNLKTNAVEVDADKFVLGMQDGLSGKNPQLTDEQIAVVMQAFQREMIARASEKAKVEGDKNLADGEAFLAANKKKEGIVSLPSGLQYKVLKAGNGKKPQKTDSVTTNYRGTLLDGTEFDSSYKRNEPASFTVDGVIPGWTEALQLMPVGSKWQLFIPAKLAYGDRGMGRDIGPNSTLVFEVELLSID